MAFEIRQVAWFARQVPSKVGEAPLRKPLPLLLDLSPKLRSQECWPPELWPPQLWIVADSWAFWIRAARRLNEQSWEVATQLDSTGSQDRKESQAALVARAVSWFEAPGIQDQLRAALHEIEATCDCDRLAVSCREFLNRGNVLRGTLHHDWHLAPQIRATVPGPIVNQNHEIGFLNMSIVAWNQLRSWHVLSHKMDRSTDRAQCCRESSVIVRRPVG